MKANKIEQRHIVGGSKGMTLVELIVVILVLLTLISVLFVGAQAYKTAADRSACIVNIRNIQLAVRSQQNFKGLEPGDSGLEKVEVYKFAGFDAPRVPECPANGKYTFQPDSKYPAYGHAALSCNLELTQNHLPLHKNGW